MAAGRFEQKTLLGQEIFKLFFGSLILALHSCNKLPPFEAAVLCTAIFAVWRLRFFGFFPPFDIASIRSTHAASDLCRPFQHLKLPGGHVFEGRIIGHLAKQLRLEVTLHGLPALPNVNPAVGIPRLVRQPMFGLQPGQIRERLRDLAACPLVIGPGNILQVEVDYLNVHHTDSFIRWSPVCKPPFASPR